MTSSSDEQGIETEGRETSECSSCDRGSDYDVSFEEEVCTEPFVDTVKNGFELFFDRNHGVPGAPVYYGEDDSGEDSEEEGPESAEAAVGSVSAAAPEKAKQESASALVFGEEELDSTSSDESEPGMAHRNNLFVFGGDSSSSSGSSHAGESDSETGDTKPGATSNPESLLDAVSRGVKKEEEDGLGQRGARPFVHLLGESSDETDTSSETAVVTVLGEDSDDEDASSEAEGGGTVGSLMEGPAGEAPLLGLEDSPRVKVEGARKEAIRAQGSKRARQPDDLQTTGDEAEQANLFDDEKTSEDDYQIDRVDEIVTQIEKRIDLRDDIPHLAPATPAPVDQRCTSLVARLMQQSRHMVVHDVIGTSMDSESLQNYIIDVTKYPTYARAASQFVTHCNCKGYGFPAIEGMRVFMEEMMWHRPPDPTRPWETPCCEGYNCQAYMNAADQNAPPHIARSYVPPSIQKEHLALEKAVLEGKDVAHEIAALRRVHAPLSCTMCHIFQLNKKVAQKRPPSAGVESRSHRRGPGPEKEDGEMKDLIQWFYHICNDEGQYDERHMIPSNGVFNGLMLHVLKYNAKIYRYVSNHVPMLMGKGKMPTFLVRSEVLFRQGAVIC